jgi:hypothetical protein
MTTKKGQIAHLDQNPANFKLDNLAWLCLEHHDEYDSTTSQSKGLTIREVKRYRNDLYTCIEQQRNTVAPDQFQDGAFFQVSYGDSPSCATVKTNDQFVLLDARCGTITEFMLETLREVLEDIKAHNSNFSTQWHNYEKLMLRGIWFDDKNGAAVLYIDYLYDQDTSPTMTVEVIKEYFHDMEGWYGGIMISVSPKIIEVRSWKDSFFAISNKFYNRLY